MDPLNSIRFRIEFFFQGSSEAVVEGLAHSIADRVKPNPDEQTGWGEDSRDGLQKIRPTFTYPNLGLHR